MFLLQPMIKRCFGTTAAILIAACGGSRLSTAVRERPEHDLRRPLDISSFGARGDGHSDDRAAIIAALAALPSTGGTIYFPAGTYVFSQPISWSSPPNVTFAGAGARYMQDFTHSPSRLVYSGSGTSPAVHVSTNYARGWQVRDLEIAYSNASFRGSLIRIDSTAGISFKHCALGGDSAGAFSPSDAQAVIQIAGSEKVTFQECIVQYAQRGIWVPTYAPFAAQPTRDDAPARRDGAHNTSLLTIRDSQLTNVKRAHVEIDNGGAIGTIIKDNLFDNTTLTNPPYGLILFGDGFSVTGNTFAGGDATKTPTTMYVDLSGYGDFSGNTILSAHPGLRANAGGSYHVSGNFVLAAPPFTIAGGAVSGAGNTWYASDRGVESAVNIAPQRHPATIDLGPDVFPYPSHNSYSVQTADDPHRISGIIRYDPRFDASRDGPATDSPFVILQNLGFQSYHLTTPTVTTSDGRETTLGAALIPAKSIDMNGKGFRFDVAGTFNGTETKRIRITFASSILYESTTTRSRNIAWHLRGAVHRTSPGHILCVVDGYLNGSIAPERRLSAVDLERDQHLYVLATGVPGRASVTLDALDVDAIQ